MGPENKFKIDQNKKLIIILTNVFNVIFIFVHDLE